MQKFVRIQGHELSFRTQQPKGIFAMCWRLIKEGIFSPEERTMFEKIDQWFKENLPEPEACRNGEKVITYFKTSTTADMMERLQPALALLDKYKHPYDIVYTNFIGPVIYEDEYQVAVRV